MAISEPCYCTREDVKAALDFKETARNNTQVDRAIQSAARAIDGSVTRPGGLLKKHFFPTVATKYFDWPNFQYAYPWRIWFDAWNLADTATSVTTGTDTIPIANINFEPINSPPYNRMEIRRDTNSSYGHSSTPQRDVAVTGTWGHSVDTDPAGSLAAAVTDTTGTTIQVTDASLVGVGDLLQIGTERLLVADRSWVTTAQTQQGTGVSTASASDVTLAVTTGSAYAIGEVLLLDSERMLVVDVTGNNLTVKRGWDGSTLAVHSGATIYAARQLTVTRGAYGTTAATHLSAAAVARNRVPSLVRQLAVAYACVALTSESSGWAKQWGEGQGSAQNLGRSIPQLEADCVASFGRQARVRAV